MTNSPNQVDEQIPEALMEKLRATARLQDVTYYSDIAPLLGIDIGNEYFGALVGRVLDRVNRREFAENRPLLSAVVVSKETGSPGRGYYGCAKDIRRHTGKSDEAAWLDELKSVYSYWAKH